MNNEQNTVSPVEQPTETNSITDTPPPPPVSTIETPVQPLATEPSPKHRKKFLYWLLAIVLILGAGAAHYFGTQKNKSGSPSAQNSAAKTYASAKKQYYLKDSVAGFIAYKPAAFQEVTVSKLPTIPVADPGVNVVIVQANVVSFSDSGLYLYDLSTNKTYRLTDGGGSPRIMSDHYLLYGFDTGSGAGKRLGGKLLNLQTGQTQTVFSDAPENIAGDVCCSVSPDGFKAAFVQKNKIGVWDIRTGKITDYPVTVDPIDPNFSRTSANDYNVEGSYAQPQWLDNSTLVYTDKPAASQVQAGQPAQIVDDTLYQLDSTTGKSAPVKTDKGGIYDIYISGGTIYFDQAPLEGTNGTTQIYVVAEGADGFAGRLLGSNPGYLLVSPDGKKVFTFDIMDSPNAYTVLDPYATDTNQVSRSFNPHISNTTTVSQVLPRGWIDNNRMLLAELDTAGTQNHEYIAIYNVSTDKVEQYIKIN